ncbi:hypothetical protein [Actinokineospora sp. UTMC 2448]|uniref:hypothetical protein n=1 Tax=Actinokineospora sp. UTMC 2448 TaxID=2268449 RepID=UPI0021646CE6|nr:hypothetical protein [Actinokineospora sp. UTMC 2448]
MSAAVGEVQAAGRWPDGGYLLSYNLFAVGSAGFLMVGVCPVGAARRAGGVSGCVVGVGGSSLGWRRSRWMSAVVGEVRVGNRVSVGMHLLPLGLFALRSAEFLMAGVRPVGAARRAGRAKGCVVGVGGPLLGWRGSRWVSVVVGEVWAGNRLPLGVYLLPLGLFAVGSAEFLMAGVRSVCGVALAAGGAKVRVVGVAGRCSDGEGVGR